MKRFLLICAFLFAFAVQAGAQNNQQQPTVHAKGLVVDSNREPVAGASVMVKGTATGTATDANGYFELTVNEGDVLEVSFLGFATADVTVGKSSTLNITLREDMKFLDEVVVVGYGTQRKGEVASAIASVKSEDFITTTTNDAIQMVKGKIPGLQVTTTDANPASSSEISLRGITTLSSSTAPLVIIDGIPGDLNTVSPSDIEQIDVLKDGSAAAIYGTRGTNGVILITTKKGKLDTPAEVDFNAYVSTQQISKTLPFLSASEYRDLAAQGIPTVWDDGANTNWLDEVTRTPVSQIYNVSLKGGGKNTNYVASFEYRGLQGIMKKSDTRVLYPRIEITHRMFDNMLKINAGVNGYKREYHVGGDGTSFNTDVYRTALIYNPTTPVYQEDGSYSHLSKPTYYNPVALLNEGNGEHQNTYLRMYADVTLTPIEGLDIKALASTSVYNSVRGYYETSKHPSSIESSRNGFASRGTQRTQDDLLEVTTQYRKTIEGHSFSVMAGYSWQKNHQQFYWMQNWADGCYHLQRHRNRFCSDRRRCQGIFICPGGSSCQLFRQGKLLLQGQVCHLRQPPSRRFQQIRSPSQMGEFPGRVRGLERGQRTVYGGRGFPDSPETAYRLRRDGYRTYQSVHVPEPREPFLMALFQRRVAPVRRAVDQCES